MKALRDSPHSQTRVDIAKKISDFFNSGFFDRNEERLSTEILRLLAKDTETRIRMILAENLKTNARMPHDIALTLAEDIEEVSTPILEFSKVLTEDDLMAVIKSTEEIRRLLAIASREHVTENISMALIEKEQEAVTHRIIKNKGAEIPKQGYEKIIDDFSTNEKMMETLVHFGKLPISISERLIDMVSDSLKKELELKYHLSTQDIDDIVLDTKEDSLLEMLASEKGTLEAQELVKQLERSHKLTNSIVLRALCRGHLDFFEAGIAKLAGIPATNAHQLLRSGANKAFEALYKKAGIPDNTGHAMFQVLALVIEEEKNGTLRGEGYVERMTERLHDEHHNDETAPVMQYVIALIKGAKKSLHKDVQVG
jgi:uncharacterized protein (DUF2336 family)